MVKVFLVDDHEVVRRGLVDLLSADPELEVIGEADSVARKSMIGSGDRADKIRTYNYTQDRVTDHRVGVDLSNLPRVMAGDLDKLIDTLITEDQAERLSALVETPA